MASVAELIEDVSRVMNERPETVNAYARALIDSGDLPKSRGRAIAQVEIKHIVKLFLAVAISPKIKDTAAEVEKYFNMRRPGVDAAHPVSLQGRAGKELCDLVEVIFSDPNSDDEKEFRRECADARVDLTLNWLEIEIHIRGGILRFKEGGSPRHWEGYIKRSVSLSGRAFLMLGSKYWAMAEAD